MQISCAETAQLISAKVFDTQIVQFLYFLNPKVRTSNHLLWDLVGNLEDMFSHDAADFVCFVTQHRIIFQVLKTKTGTFVESQGASAY